MNLLKVTKDVELLLKQSNLEANVFASQIFTTNRMDYLTACQPCLHNKKNPLNDTNDN